MHAYTGTVESLIRGPEVCVRHQLPSSLGYAPENVYSAGRPVFTLWHAHHEDITGAAAGGAAAVSEQHTRPAVCVNACKCIVIAQTLTAGRKARLCAGDRPYACCL